MASIKGVQLEEGDYGRRAVVSAAWSAEMTEYLLANNVIELELNTGKGWRGGDLLFLEKLPRLQSFEIFDFAISSVAPIHFLQELRTLHVSTYCQTEIRFSTFPHLVECGLEWRPKAASLFDCATLKNLFVNCYDGRDIAPFIRLGNLESLSVLNAPIENLHGLSSLGRLQFLRLANLRRLKSLLGIERLGVLEMLDVHSCRAVSAIDEVGSLLGLKKFCLNNDGDIESLKPLNKLNGLEWMLFYESTNILDGDLAPLLRQSKLSRVSFKNRRHYSHRREEFGDAYPM